MRSIEVSLKEILVYVLYKWVSVLLCAVIVGGLVGGYSYFKTPKGERAEQLKAELRQKEIEADASIQAAKDRIDEIEASVSDLEQNGNLSNQKVVRLYADYIYNDEFTDPAQLTRAYESIFVHYTSHSDVYKGVYETDYSEDNFREAITLTFQKQEDVFIGIIITAIGGDKADPRVMVEKLFDYFVEKNGAFALQGGEHILVKKYIQAVSIDAKDTVIGKDIEKQTQSYKNQIETLETEKSIIRQEESRMSKSTSLIMKEALFGGMIGLVIGIISVSISYLIRLPLVIPEQGEQRLNVRYLGGYRRKKHRMADAVAGDFLTWNDQHSALEYIGASISEKIAEGKSVLITGSMSESELKVFSAELSALPSMKSICFISAPDITVHASTVSLLAEVDAVILVERQYISTVQGIARQLDRIAISGKEVFGYALY